MDCTSVHFLKQKNKRFLLDLKFPREVIPEESTWSMGAVGRATFELKKRWPQTKWAKFTTLKKLAPNMHIWWAMKEQYAKEIGNLEEYVTDTKAKKMYQEEMEKAKKEEEETKSKAKEEKEKAIENGATKSSDLPQVQEEVVNANGEVETVTAEDVVNNDVETSGAGDEAAGKKKKKKKKKRRRRRRRKRRRRRIITRYIFHAYYRKLH